MKTFCKPEETTVLQKGLTNLVYTRWHNKQDVRVLSSNTCPKESDVPIQHWQRNTPGPEIVNKPEVIVIYNNMGSVDLSDQLCSYYSLACTLHKWYKYIFYILLDLAIGNAYILEKELQSETWDHHWISRSNWWRIWLVDFVVVLLLSSGLYKQLLEQSLLQRMWIKPFNMKIEGRTSTCIVRRLKEKFQRAMPGDQLQVHAMWLGIL